MLVLQSSSSMPPIPSNSHPFLHPQITTYSLPLWSFFAFSVLCSANFIKPSLLKVLDVVPDFLTKP